MSDTTVADAVDPDDAFAVLSDETRIEIMRALWATDDRTAAFSELREAVGAHDSGRFNYHLGKFDGQFVADDDDGYRLTTAGTQLVGALLSGAYTKTVDVGTIDVNDDCQKCGSPLQFAYEEGTATVSCDNCPHVTRFWIPPGAFAGYDTDELPQVAARYGRRFVRSSRDGFCPLCDGQVRATVLPIVETIRGDLAELPEIPAWVEQVPTCEFDCDRCGERTVVDLGTALSEHPAVVSFHYERGVDVTAVPIWHRQALDTDSVRFERRDPVRASVSYEIDGDELTVTVDESLSVVETAIGE
ncbi:ArsR family transcriptional regulator [Halolamina sp. CBA1230]|uniref:DUF7351 domain-containing protein n=1 Tax=Halolamina sp. CBA1230 TaxID=1853690 RepID=UPI0009A22F1D|nr:hypothetical protein [Halolamina sp. CBA1230]QKY20997.1 ArsR family transcriptional regulator [Halolamina sp. CBA1230]